MFIYLEFKTDVIAFDGKPMVLDIEATVRGDKIVCMTAWYDELAQYVNLQILSDKNQFEIEQRIWIQADKIREARTLRLVDVIAEGNRDYVKWINGGSKVLFVAFLLLSACASKHQAAAWTPPNHYGPQCINGQQQFVSCPEGQ